MKLSDAAISYLKKQSEQKPSRVHSEDLTVYNQGLVDGAAVTAQFVLDQLKPDVVVSEEIKESE